MLCEGDMNNPAGRNDAFLHSQGFQLATQHCMTGGGGLALPFLTQKWERSQKTLKRYWCSNYFWQAL